MAFGRVDAIKEEFETLFVVGLHLVLQQFALFFELVFEEPVVYSDDPFDQNVIDIVSGLHLFRKESTFDQVNTTLIPLFIPSAFFQSDVASCFQFSDQLVSALFAEHLHLL